ncbi:MAG TPA: GntG family PLP-dependent aldolase [Mycobacteriales bacterium]
MPVDLRSDTVTRPTAGMRAAMAAAEVGDDMYGEDPTVRALEERVAGLCGHEAGLFVGSGTLGNNLGLRLACPPGGELLCDEDAHVVTYELGGAAVLAGISTRTFPSDHGVPEAADVLARVRPDGFHTVVTRAIAVEQTHNRAGGTVLPLAVIAALGASGLHLHVDGARLWNACVAGGFAPDEVGRLASTMSVCLSKGLGAPVGSVLVSSAAAIEEARIWRQRMGGAMRQAGVLAAAGLYALDHHVERLADDHARAARLADALGLDPPDTNIVPVPVADAATAIARAAERGVLVGALGPAAIRVVTHLDVDDAGIDTTIPVLAGLVSR